MVEGDLWRHFYFRHQQPLCCFSGYYARWYSDNVIFEGISKYMGYGPDLVWLSFAGAWLPCFPIRLYSQVAGSLSCASICRIYRRWYWKNSLLRLQPEFGAIHLYWRGPTDILAFVEGFQRV